MCTNAPKYLYKEWSECMNWDNKLSPQLWRVPSHLYLSLECSKMKVNIFVCVIDGRIKLKLNYTFCFYKTTTTIYNMMVQERAAITN